MPSISLTHPGLNQYIQMKYAKSITQIDLQKSPRLTPSLISSNKTALSTTIKKKKKFTCGVPTQYGREQNSTSLHKPIQPIKKILLIHTHCLEIAIPALKTDILCSCFEEMSKLLFVFHNRPIQPLQWQTAEGQDNQSQAEKPQSE